MSLTDRQTRFVNEYIVSGNAAAAARAAGYSQRTARQIGSENLTKPDILAALAQKKQAEAEKLELRKEHIVAAIMGAIEMAREGGKPSVMVTGWREIARLCAFYEPEASHVVPLSAEADAIKRKLESLPTEQLLEMAAKKRALTLVP